MFDPKSGLGKSPFSLSLVDDKYILTIKGPPHEKTLFNILHSGKPQSSLLSYKNMLEY